MASKPDKQRLPHQGSHPTCQSQRHARGQRAPTPPWGSFKAPPVTNSASWRSLQAVQVGVVDSKVLLGRGSKCLKQAMRALQVAPSWVLFASHDLMRWAGAAHRLRQRGCSSKPILPTTRRLPRCWPGERVHGVLLREIVELRQYVEGQEGLVGTCRQPGTLVHHHLHRNKPEPSQRSGGQCGPTIVVARWIVLLPRDHRVLDSRTRDYGSCSIIMFCEILV